MESQLLELIKKYELRLKKGEDNLRELEKNKQPLKCQPLINTLWGVVLQDLRVLADKNKHDHLHKKRNN